MSTRNRSDRRKIGERTEEIEEILDHDQREEARVKTLEKIDEMYKIEAEKKTVAADIKARETAAETEMKALKNAAQTGKRRIEVVVEEWIHGTVVRRVRKDTGEVIEERTARADELQENLFDAGPKPVTVPLKEAPPKLESVREAPPTAPVDPDFGGPT